MGAAGRGHAIIVAEDDSMDVDVTEPEPEHPADHMWSKAAKEEICRRGKCNYRVVLHELIVYA